jgi:hypothetical protein
VAEKLKYLILKAEELVNGNIEKLRSSILEDYINMTKLKD